MGITTEAALPEAGESAAFPFGALALPVLHPCGCQFLAADHDDALSTQGLMDLGDASVLGVAEGTGKRDDVEAELVMSQAEASLGFRKQAQAVR